jgi:hypothetical protein
MENYQLHIVYQKDLKNKESYLYAVVLYIMYHLIPTPIVQ